MTGLSESAGREGNSRPTLDGTWRRRPWVPRSLASNVSPTIIFNRPGIAQRKFAAAPTAKESRNGPANAPEPTPVSPVPRD